MNVKKIVTEIDAKIANLQHAREVLLALDETSLSVGVGKPRRGRPKGISKTLKAVTSFAKAVKPKRTMSPEGRKRIAEGQKRRWAARHNKTPKSTEQK